MAAAGGDGGGEEGGAAGPADTQPAASGLGARPLPGPGERLGPAVRGRGVPAAGLA